MRSLIPAILLVLLFSGCRQEPKNIRTLDFSEVSGSGQSHMPGSDKRILRVAVSAMSSPRETFSSYEDIIKYIAGSLDIPYEFHQRRTYREINNLIETGQLDFAFICSGAYAELSPDASIEILAVPVTRGNTWYQAYIIVPDSSPAQQFADLEGLNFAFTDLLSNTGYLYPLYRIVEEKEDPDAFFKSTVFTNAHDISIQMVSRGLVDGASVHGMIFEYLVENEPERVRGIRILEKSEYFGIPPVVATFRMDDELKMNVRDILMNMHLDDNGRDLIDKLLIDKFIEGNDTDYDGIRAMRSALEK
jgi:phosphonate transport system substrate-binding protein